MAVRNFWVDINVDGRATRVGTGPRRKDGGMSARFRIREDGGISEKSITVEGREINGKLMLSAFLVEGSETVDSITIETKR